ncbi:hypothetical protein ACFFX0_29925 [Citricoccus parietis]|uniref:Uncharacterized protein n=1 Tax=Citricoccus parietis TaxID=592307 RepID=A0ABV5G950_9MICC
MAWDNNFYSSEIQQFNIFQFEQRNKGLFGGNDVIGIWPTCRCGIGPEKSVGFVPGFAWWSSSIGNNFRQSE